MSISRHFEMIYMLLDRQLITATELAKHFGVSTRTIYRDVDVLSGAGIPIYCNRGRGGGITLMEGYRFNSSLLTSREQDDILVGLQTIAATGLTDTADVLKRLANLFKKEVTNWIDVDFSTWGSTPDQDNRFNILRQGILNTKVITFTYYNSKGECSIRSVEPAKLIFKEKSWYLFAYCLTKHGHRLFKITRTKNMSLTDQDFGARPMSIITDSSPEQGVPKMVELKMVVAAQGAYRVYDECEPESITLNSDGTFSVKTQFPESDWVVSYLLSFGDLLLKVEPESLKNKLLEKLTNMKRNWTNQ
ncbi:helix-turn-helix transcriptional regulator [Amphibacillus sediminis]|uniref:helix-turn-helix transcriptional regulator n=1 Tax=Amphibacillus sediminis TaxID=360185 RepID=UPI00082997E9|nr:YafY family protein [Amphibacillus sediminis]